ncbi:MAG: hypothetical protein IJC71_05600 [Clostridia bacterium]|nr:hypothetical protein [Clostridia bacterium]
MNEERHCIVYDVPQQAPNRESVFSVAVNGTSLGLMSERNEWEKIISFGIFDADEGQDVTVEITVKIPFRSAELYPKSEGVTAQIHGQTITYTVNRPVHALSLVLDGNFKGEVLHIFSNPIDHEAPVCSEENLLYFAPGYYDLTENGGSGELVLQSGQTLYLAGGAVIDGSVSMSDGGNVTVKGSGMIMRSEEVAARSRCSNICLSTAHMSGVRVEGIICHAHRLHNWTVHFYRSENIFVRRLKIVSPVYASTDGIDITNSSHVTVEDSFIRACDDSIALKGLAGEKDKPSDCPPIENIHFSRCVLWNDCNNCMGLGAETRAAYYRNISFSDIEVIYSWDDRDHHEKLDERSVMNICCLHGTFFEDIRFERIHIDTCQRLIGMSFRDDFWFGSLPGDQSTPGGIRNVVFRDIVMEHREDSSISGEILFQGKEDKPITGITFERVSVCGEEPVVTKNAYVTDVQVL